jgi:hypothetical protein
MTEFTVDAFAAKLPEESLADILIVAIEGGVNYWATVHDYRHEGGDVRAVISDSEDRADRFEVTPETIREGLRRLVSGECKIHIPEFDGPIRSMAQGILVNPDYDYDAGDADNIVQSGLFNEIRFG